MSDRDKMTSDASVLVLGPDFTRAAPHDFPAIPTILFATQLQLGLQVSAPRSICTADVREQFLMIG